MRPRRSPSSATRARSSSGHWPRFWGLDTLVFTGGIGAHAVPVRWRICEGLEFLGIRLVPRRNAAHAPIISCDDNPVTVRMMRTNEDLMIARHTRRLVTEEGVDNVPF